MLYAKINPKATFMKETGPFTQATSFEAEYIIALARPYTPGAAETNFEVIFGNIIPEVVEVLASEGVQAVTGHEAHFIQVSSSQLTLTSEELKEWGLNDEILLSTICNKLGTAASEFTSIVNKAFVR